MAVSVEEVQADIVPDLGEASRGREQQSGRPMDMDRVTCELRRAADRLARKWAD